MISICGQRGASSAAREARDVSAGTTWVKTLWGVGPPGGDPNGLISYSSNILTPSIRYLEHCANGLQTFSPANP